MEKRFVFIVTVRTRTGLHKLEYRAWNGEQAKRSAWRDGWREIVSVENMGREQ
jgi:hypothetical protein